MIWAVIYIAGAGVYTWLTLPWMLRYIGPRNGKADEHEQWASVALTLLQAVFWPFFAVVAAAMMIGEETKRR